MVSSGENNKNNNNEKKQNMFTVTVNKKEVVAPVLPLQEHWLPLSNLDLLLPPLNVGVLFCYKKQNTSNNTNNNGIVENNDNPVLFGVLKKAMAQVLVTYYAFAGEVVANSVGEPELLCNNRGIDFFEAFADVDLRDLDLYNPDQSVEGKLVPQKKDGVLAVQVTELKCGGLVVACSFDHRVADAYSGNMFLVSWAETARSEAITLMPSFRRSLLNPRRPGLVDHGIDNMYVPLSKMPLPDPTKDVKADHLISRIYYVKYDELIKLQSICSPEHDNKKRTKLESFSAFLWQMVAKSSVKDGNITNGKIMKSAKLGMVVDGRTRLSENNQVPRNNMSTYFGNVLSIPYGTKGINELIQNPLNWVASEVHNFLDTAVTKEHFLGLIDWVEARRPEPAVAKIYLEDGTGPAIVVSSGQRFPVSKVDFGWGSPFFGSYHFPWGGSCGYVMPMPSPLRNGDWIVYMHLLSEQVKYIEAEAAQFFKPLSFDYLNSTA